MCGIVASVSTRNIVPILVQGLQRLEYRGYDSCGVAVYAGGLKRARSTSRVAELQEQVSADKLEGGTGIAHTRWATHGAPAVHNAHPHFSHGSGPASQSKPGKVALVHNGIIENYEELREGLKAKGYAFESQTTPKSSSTCSTACMTATSSKPSRPPSRNCTAPTPSPRFAKTSRIASSARAPARR